MNDRDLDLKKRQGLLKQTWDDVYDILYDGTEEQVRKVRCLVCGGEIHFEYYESESSSGFTVTCDRCRVIQKERNGPKPNCVEFFGERVILNDKVKIKG